jgi:hypothetical protein
MRNGFLGKAFEWIGFHCFVRTWLLAGSLTSTAACVTSGGTGDGGGSGGGWTAMPLVDDASNPVATVYHEGNDQGWGSGCAGDASGDASFHVPRTSKPTPSSATSMVIPTVPR